MTYHTQFLWNEILSQRPINFIPILSFSVTRRNISYEHYRYHGFICSRTLKGIWEEKYTIRKLFPKAKNRISWASKRAWNVWKTNFLLSTRNSRQDIKSRKTRLQKVKNVDCEIFCSLEFLVLGYQSEKILRIEKFLKLGKH